MSKEALNPLEAIVKVVMTKILNLDRPSVDLSGDSFNVIIETYMNDWKFQPVEEVLKVIGIEIQKRRALPKTAIEVHGLLDYNMGILCNCGEKCGLVGENCFGMIKYLNNIDRLDLESFAKESLRRDLVPK